MFDRELTNRLAAETSPYLLQHADNPVAWQPWDDQALLLAKEMGKPIFLSIGYSTCHWCHVMERESFANDSVAALLNQHFIPIKLDREERPDLDHLYMTAYQAMSEQGGGWPLNVFLTPDLKLLTGGTYFPPENKGGRIGFPALLKEIHLVWQNKPKAAQSQADHIHRQIAHYYQEKAGTEGEKVTAQELQRAAGQVAGMLDPDWGGFGEGPKFPQATALQFLLQSGVAEAEQAALHTLVKMAEGGLHDHLAGGFHRYTVDREWLVPHFEKMLYDQAQLLDAYLDAFLLTGEERFAEVARGIARHVLGELTHPEGGFFAAQDAQSEGKEGKFACWTEMELAEVLETEELAFAQKHLGVSRKGNFFDHSDPEALEGQNILHLATEWTELSEAEQGMVEQVFEKLRPVRERRVPPATDDKILSGWNGLMIGGLSRAARVLEDSKLLDAAERAHLFVKSHHWDGQRLAHSWRDGRINSSAQSQSYLYLLQGTRRLYEATLNPDYLGFAEKLAAAIGELFYDYDHGGVFNNPERSDVVLRLKGDFDQATPLESAVLCQEFALLGDLLDEPKWRELAEQTREHLGDRFRQAPQGMGTFAMACQRENGRKPQLFLNLAGATPEKRAAFLQAAFQNQRWDLLRQADPTADGQVEARLCEDGTCQLPVADPERLALQLGPQTTA